MSGEPAKCTNLLKYKYVVHRILATYPNDRAEAVDMKVIFRGPIYTIKKNFEYRF